jgi:hypothetical protein
MIRRADAGSAGCTVEHSRRTPRSLQNEKRHNKLVNTIMALSSEDQIEVQLLIVQEFEKLLNESSGFAEARRAVDKRKRELEADLLDHQRSRGDSIGMWKIDSES